MSGAVRVLLLGDVQAALDDGPVILGGVRPAAVLALLALRAPRAVSRDVMIDALWGEDPPKTASTAVQVAVSNLRKVLGSETVLTAGSAYRLVQSVTSDVSDLEAAIRRGRAMLEAGEVPGAAAVLSQALLLWRGPPLSNLGSVAFAEREARHLSDLRATALQLRLDADLAAGRHQDLVPELHQLVDEAPLSEEMRGKLMQALYRSGRQADALAVYDAGRTLLADELGLDPSPALQDLHRQILTQTMPPAPPTAPRTVPSRRARPRLPTAPAMVGREPLLAQLLLALAPVGDERLLTLTGPGGTGKTRLSIAVAEQAADRFPDGVVFVPLASATTEPAAWASIADALQTAMTGHARDSVLSHVEEASMLVVLDNLEQLPAAATIVEDLFSTAPGLVVLATSRTPLHLPLEYEHPVPPLALPTDISDVEASPAVRLLAQQIRKVNPSFTPSTQDTYTLAAICQRLDGLPLAMELAAARTKLLTPAALLARLDAALDLPSTGDRRPGRHHTMRETIAWSYNLLDAPQQTFFRRLGVFAGGASLDAVTAVTTDIHDGDPLDMLADLADASLLTVTDQTARGDTGEQSGPSVGPRVMMMETMRSYAADALSRNDELDQARLRHATHYAQVAHELYATMVGPSPEGGRARFTAELPNLRQVVTCAFAGLGESPADMASIPDSPDRSGRMDLVRMGMHTAVDLAPAFISYGDLTEFDSWLQRAVQVAGSQHSREVVTCRWRRAQTLCELASPELARHEAQAALDLARRIGDRNGEVESLDNLGNALLDLGELDQARAALESGVDLGRAHNLLMPLSSILSDLSVLETRLEDFDCALALRHEVIDVDRQLDFKWALNWDLLELGRLQFATGDLDAARASTRSVANDILALGDNQLIDMLGKMCALTFVRDDTVQLARVLGALAAARERQGLPKQYGGGSYWADQRAQLEVTTDPDTWQRHFEEGRGLSLPDLVRELIGPPN